MVLLKRMMWPRKNDEVTIVKDGKLFIEGHVIHADDNSITVLGRNSVTAILTSKELHQGIEDGSLVIKKKTGPLR